MPTAERGDRRRVATGARIVDRYTGMDPQSADGLDMLDRALDDTVLDDTVLDDTVLDDTVLDRALDDTVLDDTVLDDTVLDVRAAVAAIDPVDAERSDDPYAAATAEYYELLATAHWQRTGDELSDLLRDIDPTAGPIVDVGAGTGIGLPYLLSVSADAEVYAIEPSKAMRTALHTRLLLDPRLRGRVTVDPRPLGDALPDRASAVVMSAVLGHLDDAERERLWRFVADRMPAGAPVVAEVLPPHRPVVVEPVRYAAVPVGRFVYEGWQSGRPVDERRMQWTMTYRVLDGRSVISERAVTSTYRCWSPDDVVAEVAPYGLTVTEHGDAVVVRR